MTEIRQVDDPLVLAGLDRDSLPKLFDFFNRHPDPAEAARLARWTADPTEITAFVDALFRHASDGYIQLRCFVEGSDAPWGMPWPAVHAKNRDALIRKACKQASRCALVPERVVFCPPVGTFRGTERARESDLCQGLAIMVELDSHPTAAQTRLEEVLGAPTLVTLSGGISKDDPPELRRHVYWRLTRPTQCEREHAALKKARDLACRLVGSDTSAKPVCHPLRWPGSWHRKQDARLTQILTVTDHEVDLDAALDKLEEAARDAGIRLPGSRPASGGDACPQLDLARDPALWRPERQGRQIIDDYLSLSDGRRCALAKVSKQLVMSAINHRYDIGVGELHDILADLQAQNTPSSGARKDLFELAESAIPLGRAAIGDEPAYRRKAGLDAWIESQVEDYRQALADDRAARAEHGQGLRAGDASANGDPDDEEICQPARPARSAETGDGPAPAPLAQPKPAAAENAPLDVFASLSPGPVLAKDMLPPAIANFAFDEAERLGIEPAAVALPCLIACAAAIDDAITIQPKAEDVRWTESARLWGAIVGDPGAKKTPAITKAIEPLRAVERDWRDEDDKAYAEYCDAMEDYKHQRAQFKLKERRGEDPGPEPKEPKKPPRRRLIVNDLSMEGLAERILVDNERGVLINHQELMGFIGGFDAYRSGGAKKDRPAALELFDGGPRNRDLVRDTIWVPNWSASILGGIQTDKLEKLAPSLADDGLLQRFLIAEVKPTGLGDDRRPDLDAIDDYAWTVRHLTMLKADDFDGPVELSDAAQAHRREVERVVYALKNETSLSPAFRSHAAKLDGIFARLLLVLHIVEAKPFAAGARDLRTAQVSGETAKMARDLIVRFFVPHALHLYVRCFGEGAANDARWIAGHILARRLKMLSARDLQRANRAFKSVPSRALQSLVEHRWITPVPGKPGVPPSKWTVNPLVHERFAERAVEERQRRDDALVAAASRRQTLDAAFGNT